MATPISQKPADDVRSKVREHYGQIAANFQPRAACCGGGDPDPAESSAAQLYDTPDVANLPESVTGLSLGSGDPITLADLQPGETVIDLGSGGGIDCFLAAQRVGEAGHVIGVDMTAQMIEKARANTQQVGTANVEFRLGEIEHLPVPDETADAIVSNCVINLSPDKPQVFREAFRALKPGGRLAISDIMTSAPLPDPVRESMSAWAGCVGGALDADSYIAAVEAAGFTDVELTRIYFEQQDIDELVEELDLGEEVKDGKHLILRAGDSVEVIELDEPFDRESLRPFSGKLTARKPAN